ncbi:MAG: transporter [Candidatus Acidiferrales bacterium]
MTRAVLVLVVLFPLALTAQEKEPGTSENQTGVTGSIDANRSSRGTDGFSAELKTETDLGSKQDPNAAQQSSAKPRESQKPPVEPGPKIPGSMVGYIDEAIVESQVRVRFDAAFHNHAPDRAEFFYAQCSCISSSAPGPNSGVVDLNFQQLYMYAEYAPVKRFSFFANVPIRWIQPLSIPLPGTPQLTNEAGLSDVAAGFKLAALASYNHYLTFQFQAYFPTGNASRGLGTNHYSFEPAMLYYQRVSDRIALEAQVGDSHPIGGSYCPNPSCNSDTPTSHGPSFAGDVFFYGLGPSYVLYRGENVQIAPVIELAGWRVLGGFVTENSTLNSRISEQKATTADGTNIVNLKLGVRTMIGTHSSFYIGYGHQLTHAWWYQEIVRAEYRYSF